MSAHPSYVIVPEERVPVIREVDVLVCGGGPAGVCAAVAAARMGANVMVVERHGFFGGMATAALVAVWHKLYGTDYETQVIHGLPQEIVEKLYARNAVHNDRKDHRGNYFIETEYAKLIFDELIIQSKVTPLLHSWVADVVMDGPDIDYVIVQNKSGRQAIRAKIIIDATGDADVAARAGAPYEKGNKDGYMQPPTLCFRLGGIDESKGLDREKMKEVLNRPMDYNGQEYPNYLWTSRSAFRPDERMVAGVRVTEVDSTDGWSFSRAEMEGRQQMEWVVKQLKENIPAYENAYIVDIGSQIGIRESRRIVGEHVLQEDEVLKGIRFHDVIAQGTYPVDIHNPLRRGILFKELDGTTREIMEDGSLQRGFWTEDGQKRDTVCYQIPYRSLLPKNVDNLLVAGRCLSATHEAAGAARVMVNCMQMGQAAGVASVLSIDAGKRPREVDAGELHAGLKKQDVEFLPASSEDEKAG